MAKFTTSELLAAQAQGWAMRQEGATMTEIRGITGMNGSQAWLGNAIGEMADSGGKITPVEPTGKAIAEARMDRASKYVSWGWLEVRCGIPESRVRRLYTEHTNLQSVGGRTGKGGRFASGLDYEGDASKYGHDVPVQGDLAVRRQELVALAPKELNVLLKAAGLPATGKKDAKIAALLGQ